MRRIGLAAVLALLGAAAGCTEYWVKPGASEREFEVMRGQCSQRAYRRFPPMLYQTLSQEGHYAPAVSHCVTKGNSTECSKSPGGWVPPTYATIDANGEPRSQDIRSCYFENGWKPEEKKG
jgi:hypothetical protein